MERLTLEEWRSELGYEDRHFEPWRKRARKIVKRYRDERDESSRSGSKYNILWANVQTIKPAVYSRPPKPEVSRRYDDQDPAGRAAAMILERCLSYEIEHYPDFLSMLDCALSDRLLAGRGVGWVRYEPTMTRGQQVTEDVADILQYEQAPCDYVAWEDFHHQPAKTWEEVEWVARDVLLSKDALHQRFDESLGKAEVDRIPLSVMPSDPEKSRGGSTTQESKHMQRARVTEIWHKPTKTAVWIADGYDKLLDEQDDPLGLDCFYPCAKPLFATMTTDSLVPVPDYAQYQDQAKEMDQLTARIDRLVSALRVAGVRDASASGLDRLLSEHTENVLVPVENWAMFADKGIASALSFMPIDMIAAVLQGLYDARERVKQTIYEITGLSDIVRGASVASETATAQQIKNQYASLRIKALQNDVARFAEDYLRMKAQIIAKYEPQTLIMMSGAEYSVEAKNNPEILMQALQIISNDDVRAFRIEVNADLMVQLDEQEEKQSRVEFLTAVGGFLEKAVAAAQAVPQMTPLLGEMLRFGVRGFKAGREIESAFDSLMAEGIQPPPNPKAGEQQKAMEQQQAAMQAEKDQIEKAKAQLAEKGMKLSVDEIALKGEKEIMRIKDEHKRDVEALQKEYQGQWEGLSSRVNGDRDKAMQGVYQDVSGSMQQLGQHLQAIAAWMQKASEGQEQIQAQIAQGNEALAAMFAESGDRIAKAVSAKRVLVRDKNGRAVASQIEGEQP